MSAWRLKGILWSLAVLSLWGSLGAPWALAAEEKEGDKAVGPGQIGVADVCPCTFGPLIAESAIPIDKGKFAFQTTIGVKLTGGSFSPGWRRTSVDGNFVNLSAVAKFTYGILPKTEVFVVTGYQHNWAAGVSDSQTGQNRSADFGGWTDTVRRSSACFGRMPAPGPPSAPSASSPFPAATTTP